MKCINCGNELNNNELFCSNCGMAINNNSNNVNLNNQQQYINNFSNSLESDLSHNNSDISNTNIVNNLTIQSSVNSSEKINKKTLNTIIIVIVIFILIIISIIFLVKKNNNQNIDELKTSQDSTIKVKVDDNSVTINNEVYYIVKDNDTYLTLLKGTPLTVDEIDKYGEVNTANNHVNKYASYDPGKAHFLFHNGEISYGGMSYYDSPTCGYPKEGNYSVYIGCTTDYDKSNVKYVIDAWAKDKFNDDELATDFLGYQVRLITLEETINLGYTEDEGNGIYIKNNETPEWTYNIYDSSTSYWTMTASSCSSDSIWTINHLGKILPCGGVSNEDVLVRPVINIYKSVIQK